MKFPYGSPPLPPPAPHPRATWQMLLLQIREAFKDLMRNLTKKLGAVEGSEDDLMKTFEFEKELAKVWRPMNSRYI